MKKFAIVVHGGAGTILKKEMTPQKEALYHQGIEDALKAGFAVLEKKGKAIDAVEAAVNALEDFPLFNAGRGSVFNHEGNHEMDAAIMDGSNLKCGAVCAVRNVKNPVSLARKVMDHSEHIILSGNGAEQFAHKHALAFEKDEYFFVQHRYDQWQKALRKDKSFVDHITDKQLGTVGAVAVDARGNVAAATSTGGLTNKKFGRIGDTPIIGGGTYANNKTCAISCTGHGEYFIRTVLAHEVSALMELKGLSLQKAADFAVNKKLAKLGGDGGLIAIDRRGNIAMPFNSSGMYRGFIKSDGEMFSAIYK